MNQQVEEISSKLIDARLTGSSTPAPHTIGLDALDVAYAVAEQVFEWLHHDLTAATGYKVSLVGDQHRAAFNAKEPTFGRFIKSEILEDPRKLSINSLYCPLVEPELVFRLDRDLGMNATPEEVRRSTHVTAGMEIPDSRLSGWFPVPNQTVCDLVTDNSFAGVLVHADSWIAADGTDLRSVVCTLTHNGQEVGAGRGEDVMGDPILAVCWLSRALARSGQVLRSGDLVSSGTFAPVPPRASIGNFVAEFSGVGSISVRFE